MFNYRFPVNLQLFALPGDAQHTGSPGLSAENKEFYDTALIDAAGPELVHEQWAQTRNIPPRNGDTVEFRRFAPLPKATTPLSEGQPPVGNTLTVTTIKAEVKQYGAYIRSTDWLNLTAIDDIMMETIMLQGRQAGLTMDTVVRDVLNSGTNVHYCPKVAADTGVETPVTMRSELDETAQLTVKQVQQVAAELAAYNAPKINGSYVGIIHPYVAYDLSRDPEWKDWHKYTDASAMYNREIGKVAGVRFSETSEAKVFEGGVFSTLILGQNAYGVTKIGNAMETIIHNRGEGGSATDPLDQLSTIGWKANRAAEILIDEYLVRVESKSAQYSATTEAN